METLILIPAVNQIQSSSRCVARSVEAHLHYSWFNKEVLPELFH